MTLVFATVLNLMVFDAICSSSNHSQALKPLYKEATGVASSTLPRAVEM